MLVSLIAAMAKNRVIAGANGIPWNMPRDREHFRAYTSGKAMLIGSRTYTEMRGWFTNHLPIILTSRSPADAHARHVVRDVASAITLAQKMGAAELVVSGGALTYQAALPHVQKMILTQIDADFDGHILFPEWNPAEWLQTDTADYPADAQNPHPMRIISLLRVNPPKKNL